MPKSENAPVVQKLVRDNIVTMIEAEGRTAEYVILNDEEYLRELNKKLREESEEFIRENSKEELADILEVIYALAKVNNFAMDEIEEIRRQKQEKNGGFEKRIYLKSTKPAAERPGLVVLPEKLHSGVHTLFFRRRACTQAGRSVSGYAPLRHESTMPR